MSANSKFHIPKCSSGSLVSGMDIHLTRPQCETKISKMASKMAAKSLNIQVYLRWLIFSQFFKSIEI
jgi:hypothetical protein